MSAEFLNALENENNKTVTVKGAEAFKSTKSDLLDFYSVAGAMRTESESVVTRKFRLAYAEDKLLAMKALFMTRNVRGGNGERRVTELILRDLVKYQPDVVEQNLFLLPHYGRFDDLMWMFGTQLEGYALELIGLQLTEDLKNLQAGQPISLLGKWLPSINTSSKETRAKAKIIIKSLGIQESTYRKTLSKLRKYIDVVEVKMSSKKWGDINYSAVPSKAMKQYKNAFAIHDKDGFDAYITKVESGEAKINSGTLYPYELVAQVFNGNYSKVTDLQWEALPNYVEGEHNTLVMADVSGSMTCSNGMPLYSSIGLAMYFAERNTGVFKNKFMTFSEKPALVTIKGTSFGDRVRNINSADWNMTTNFERALDLILDTAVQANLLPSELPKKLVVISDMQFDSAVGGSYSYYSDRKVEWGFYSQMKRKYTSKGYDIPQIVFWNVNATKDTYPVQANQEGVALVSGQSPSMFKYILNGEITTPYDMMIEALNDPMYDLVTV